MYDGRRDTDRIFLKLHCLRSVGEGWVLGWSGGGLSRICCRSFIIGAGRDCCLRLTGFNVQTPDSQLSGLHIR